MRRATTAGGGGGSAMVTARSAPSRRGLAIGIAAAAVGVGALAVGGGLFGLASSDASTLHKVALAGQPWTAADQAKFDQGEHAQTAAIVLVSVGGALVVGGAVALVVSLRR